MGMFEISIRRMIPHEGDYIVFADSIFGRFQFKVPMVIYDLHPNKGKYLKDAARDNLEFLIEEQSLKAIEGDK